MTEYEPTPGGSDFLGDCEAVARMDWEGAAQGQVHFKQQPISRKTPQARQIDVKDEIARFESEGGPVNPR